tara:strand:- start:364 stop:597 length:234 start_codon:yes stop_codon:yes gene_type:complete
MEVSLDKALKTLATLSLCVIAVQLIPISKVADVKAKCLESFNREGKAYSDLAARKLGLRNNSEGWKAALAMCDYLRH